MGYIQKRPPSATERTNYSGDAMDANNPKGRELTEKSPNQSKGSNHKGRSCKGTLYYSRALKSKNYSPFCIGIPRNIIVPKPVVAEIEMDAAKDNRRLAEFRFVCAGYSMYLDRIKDKSSQTEPSELPLCSGLELLVGTKAPNRAPAAAPVAAHVHHKDDDCEVPKNLKHKPTPKPAPDVPGLVFLNRFSRNADVVASGVSKNIGKVGNFIKARLYNIVYPK